MSREPMNIVVLGGSFAGLSVAHNFLRKVIDQLGTTRTAPRYRLVLVSPSTHLYWNIGAPRALVSQSLIPHTQSFHSIPDAFRDYAVNRFSFIHGSAIKVDFSQRNVTVAVYSEPSQPVKNASARDSYISRDITGTGTGRQSTQILPFHALIIATGSSADSPLLSLHGPHEQTIAALNEFQAGLRDATSIIIVGGGPSGVECAGQLATYFNRGQFKSPHGRDANRSSAPTTGDDSTSSAAKSRFSTYSAVHPKRTSTAFSIFSRRRHSAPPGPSQRTPKQITLISGSERLLRRLPPAVSKAAETKLRKMGVHIIHDIRVGTVTRRSNGKYVCVLSSKPAQHPFLKTRTEREGSGEGDITISCDLHIAATGVRPNTGFLPRELLDATGYVHADPRFLRVERAGERVFAVGDCAAYSMNNILDVYDSIPALMHNLRNDLWAYEIKRQNPFGGSQVVEQIEALVDMEYVQQVKQSQICPVSRWGGVGVFMGTVLPSFAVHLLKGRDYRVGKARSVVERGMNPYASPV